MLVVTRGYVDTIWLFNIAMENDPFIDDFPINTTIYRGFSMATLNNQRVYQTNSWALETNNGHGDGKKKGDLLLLADREGLV